MQSPGQNKPPETAPVIEGYDILDKLGHGGTSSVWRARQVSLGRIVVIKVLYEHLAHDPEDIRHFKHEALIAANLKHPGIVQVYDFGRFKEGAGYYFVMEYISGYTVGDWLRRKGKLEESDSLIVAHSVADALRYAWDQAMIVHCDIKPENIMVDGDGTIKVTDLGLAQVVSTIGSPARATQEVYIMGTPNYMSPEQARGEKNLDCRTDIYALGATLHHMLTGELPFGPGDMNEIMEHQICDAFEDPRKSNSRVSAGAACMIMKMLAKNADDRYQNWKEVLVDIISLGKASANIKTASLPAEQSDMERASSTIPLQVISDQHASQGSAQSQPPASAADDMITCPYCAEPIRKRAVYCRYCGKEVATKPGPSGGIEKKNRKLGLKALPPDPAPAPSPAPEPPAPLKTRRHFPFGCIFRTLISLALLWAVGVYGYNRLVKGEDIMIPIRTRIVTGIIPAWNQLREKAERWVGGEQSGDKEFQPLEQPSSAPVSQESFPPPPAQPAQAPVVNNNADNTAAAVSQQPVSTPAESSQPASTETEEQRIMRGDDYQQLLKRCEELRPSPGQQIELKLKDQPNPLSGILDNYQPDGLVIKIPSGSMTVPFVVMEEKTRLLYFPKDHAMFLYRRQNRGR